MIIGKNITFSPQLLDEPQIVIEFRLEIAGFVLGDGVRYATRQCPLVASETLSPPTSKFALQLVVLILILAKLFFNKIHVLEIRPQ